MTDKEITERLADAIPSSWLDPLLTGKNKVIGEPPYDCPDIEHLLNGIRERIKAILKATK